MKSNKENTELSMIVNVDDLFANKPKMNSFLYFGLIGLAVIFSSYVAGAEKPALIGQLLCIASITLSFSYPVYLYLAFRVRRAAAVDIYRRHLKTKDIVQIKQMLFHKDLSNFSKPIIEQHIKFYYPTETAQKLVY